MTRLTILAACLGVLLYVGLSSAHGPGRPDLFLEPGANLCMDASAPGQWMSCPAVDIARPKRITAAAGMLVPHALCLDGVGRIIKCPESGLIAHLVLGLHCDVFELIDASQSVIANTVLIPPSDSRGHATTLACNTCECWTGTTSSYYRCKADQVDAEMKASRERYAREQRWRRAVAACSP